MKSNCCHADMQVESADEGTSCYVCQKCLKACDPEVKQNKKDDKKSKRKV